MRSPYNRAVDIEVSGPKPDGPMRRIVYKIKPGTHVRAEPDGRYSFQVPDNPKEIRLDPPAVAPLLLLDGWRSEESVEHKLTELGTRLPPGEIGPFFRKLALVGVLVQSKTEWMTPEWSPWPVHHCQGCGASCQGHWIGPLNREFIAKTQPRLEELRAKYPRLRDVRPFVRLDPDDPALYLNVSSGQCLFLDDEMRCILHDEYGPTEKPSVCQMFPVTRIEDATTTRLGIGLGCLADSEQVLDSDPNAQDDDWRQLHAGLDGRLFHSYPPELHDGEESQLVGIVQANDDPLLAVLKEFDLRSERFCDDPGPVRLEHLARLHLARVETALAAEPVIEAMCKRKGLLPKLVNAIRAVAQTPLDGSDSEPHDPLLAVRPSSDRMRIMRDALRRFFYLRFYRHFPQTTYSMAAFCLGLWVSTTLAKPGKGEDQRFGQFLSVWMRLLRTPALQTKLFANFDEVDEFLSNYQAVAT